MSIALLEREAESLVIARVAHSQQRLETLLADHKGFISTSLRLHFVNLIKRSLQRHPDGRDLDLVIKGIEDFLCAHKRRLSAMQSLTRG